MRASKSIKKKYMTKGVDHPDGQKYFNYRERVERELGDLTRQTGITNWQSRTGQLVLAELQSRNLRDGVHLELGSDGVDNLIFSG